MYQRLQWAGKGRDVLAVSIVLLFMVGQFQAQYHGTSACLRSSC